MVEGWKMFEEIPPILLKETLISENFYAREKQKIQTVLGEKGGRVELVSEDVFSYVADTKTPQGILSVVKKPRYDWKDFETEGAHLLFLEDLQDPGNLGTIFRSAEAAGATGVVCSENCVDLFNPKVIRSTMGSIFRMPFLVVEDFPGAIQRFQGLGVRMFAADLSGSKPHWEEDFKGSLGFLIGNEGAGLSPKVSDLADDKVLIPMDGKVESLNAGIAATLLMFEAKRQRTYVV